LFARDDVKKAVQKYLRECFHGLNNTSGKFPLFGTAGVPGIGKTEFLNQVCQKWAFHAFPPPSPAIATMYLTFNGGKGAANICTSQEQSLLTKQFADFLLQTCYDISDVPNIHQPHNFLLMVVKDLHAKLAGTDGVLVICVDEVAHLKERAATMLSILIGVQDALAGDGGRKGATVVFIFTSILDRLLLRQRSSSGHEVVAPSLLPIPFDLVFNSVLKDFQDLWKSPSVYQLVLSCGGNPRATVAALQAQLASFQVTDQEAVCALNVLTTRTRVLEQCKLNTFELSEDILKHWFGLTPVDDTTHEDLVKKGILHRLREETTDFEFILPLFLQHWAHQKQRDSLFGQHLHALFSADLFLGQDAEKNMEAVMYNYEAIRRLSFGSDPFTLSKFYPTNHFGLQHDTCVTIHQPPSTNSLVRFVEDFSKLKEVVEYLKEGFIVVSRKNTEIGVEYLAPFRKSIGPADTAEGPGKRPRTILGAPDDLLVACIQCKFVSEHTTWADIKEKMLTATRQLEDAGIDWFPVVYTTANQRTMFEQTYKKGVYFLETDLFMFTRQLGILRLHTMKLGSELAQCCPVLLPPKS